DPKKTTGTIAFHVDAGPVADPNPRGTWIATPIPINGVNVPALGRINPKFTVNPQGQVTGSNSDSGLNSATFTVANTLTVIGVVGTATTLSRAEAKWNANVTLNQGAVTGLGSNGWASGTVTGSTTGVVPPLFNPPGKAQAMSKDPMVFHFSTPGSLG